MGQAFAKPAKNKLTLRKPSELLAMRFDDSDKILGDRLLAIAQSLVIAAMGGAGKSRLLLQLLASIIARLNFLTFETGCPELRWLVLQTENSNRRLQYDLKHLEAWLGKDWRLFEERVTFHAIENDSDSFVSLDDNGNVARIAAAIEEVKPGGIVIDPLNDFAIGDLNKDADMRATLQTLSRVCRKGDPQRSLIVLHHALTGKGGSAKATGYDRSSFARNSKALHAWTRGQINLAPVDADNNDRLIVACGKCSNGKEFPTFGIRLNPETMIYECDPSIDVADWEKEVSGKKDGPLMTPDRVREFCSLPRTKAELAKDIREDCGCARTVAYKYIRAAENRGRIKFNPKADHYTAK
jgi:hypothetical protein